MHVGPHQFPGLAVDLRRRQHPPRHKPLFPEPVYDPVNEALSGGFGSLKGPADTLQPLRVKLGSKPHISGREIAVEHPGQGELCILPVPHDLFLSAVAPDAAAPLGRLPGNAGLAPFHHRPGNDLCHHVQSLRFLAVFHVSAPSRVIKAEVPAPLRAKPLVFSGTTRYPRFIIRSPSS